MLNMRKLFVGVITLIVGCAIAFGEEAISKQRQSSWFTPSLTINKSDTCSSLLEKVKETYFSNKYYGDIFYDNATRKYRSFNGISPVEYGLDPDVTMEKIDYKGQWGKGYYLGTPTIILGEKKYYLHPQRTPGCGGACEGYYLSISNQRLPENWNDLSTIPSSDNYKIYKDENKNIWSFSIDNDIEFNAYQVKHTGTWEKSCSIKLRPNNIGKSEDTKVQDAMKALNNFKLAVFGLTRGAGSCGSMRTHSRWTSSFASNLPIILYRPWLYEGYEDRPRGKYTHISDTYENDVAGLKDWSLMGLSEYESYHDYLRLMDKTSIDISTFYQNKFGWDKARSDKLAKSTLIAAVDGTIRFYMYEPIKSDGERQLRKAILEHKPIEEIKAIKVEIKDQKSDGGESLLSVAVLYPEALKYLLKKGLDPDHKNDFGKTPLIYAVQYNQPESVRLLLDAGADPNAKTTHPWDTCFYTIRTFHMTPLHYAARYASPEVIKMLLDYGAAPFIKADNQKEYPATQETPLDWLNIYTVASSEEKNPNMADDKVATVKEWLKPLDKEASDKLAIDYVLEAEKLYHKQKVEKAYRTLDLALELQPGNERGLSDMSLIAKKNGDYGKALKSANQLIKLSKSDKLKANAYYNLGLICREKGPTYYDGKSYCDIGGYISKDEKSDNGALASFLNAFKLKPTDARRDVVLTILRKGDKEDGKGVCTFPEGASGVHSVYFNSVNWYFLVDAEKSVSFKSVSGYFSNGEVAFSAKRKDTIKLTDDLKVERWSMNQGYYTPLRFDDWICSPTKPEAHKKDTTSPL